MSKPEDISQDAWGAKEHKARLEDIAAYKRDKISLEEAQDRASQRRKEAGLSHGKAAALVSDHVRDLRYAALSEGK